MLTSVHATNAVIVFSNVAEDDALPASAVSRMVYTVLQKLFNLVKVELFIWTLPQEQTQRLRETVDEFAYFCSRHTFTTT